MVKNILMIERESDYYPFSLRVPEAASTGDRKLKREREGERERFERKSGMSAR